MAYTKPVRLKGGAMLASLLAGPLFLLMMTIAMTQRSPSAIDVSQMGAGFGLVLILPIIAGVGMVISIVPNLIGMFLLKTVGTHNIGLRLPVIWALAGGMLGSGGAWWMDMPQPLAVALSGTGAVCALVCRRGVVWP